MAETAAEWVSLEAVTLEVKCVLVFDTKLKQRLTHKKLLCVFSVSGHVTMCPVLYLHWPVL